MKLRALFLLPLLFLALPSAVSAAAPTCTMWTVPTSIPKGGSFTLKWSATPGTAGSITGVKPSVSSSGSINLIPVQSTRYTGTFTNAGGKAICDAIIYVEMGGSASAVLNASGTSDSPLLPLGELDSLAPPGTIDPGGSVNSPGTVGSPGTVSSPGTLTAPGTINTPAPLEPQVQGALPTLPQAQPPTLSNNPGKGLIPCGNPGDPGGATGCQACHVASLAQNIINFLIGLSIPLAAAMFAYAGFLYFTSGVMDKVEKGRKVFTSVLIGFCIVVAGYLVIETVLHTILQESYFTSWNQISCIQEPINSKGGRQLNKNISELINSIPFLNNAPLPVVIANPQPVTNYNGTPGGAIICQTGSSYDQGSKNCQSCYDDGFGGKTCEITAPLASAPAINAGCPVGAVLDPSGYNCQICYDDGFGGQQCDTVAPNPPLSNTDCSAENIMAAAQTGGYNLTSSQAMTLSCIAVPESACGRNTSVATTPTGQVTSATGMFQIVMGYSDQCHSLNIPVCTQAAQAAGYTVSGNLNCSQHFRGGKPIDYIGEACKAAASNINCNASAAACLVQANNGKFTDWTADSRSSKQTQCIQQYSN